MTNANARSASATTAEAIVASEKIWYSECAIPIADALDSMSAQLRNEGPPTMDQTMRDTKGHCNPKHVQKLIILVRELSGL